LLLYKQQTWIQTPLRSPPEDFLRQTLESHLCASISFSFLNGSNPLTRFPLGFIFTTPSVSEYYTLAVHEEEGGKLEKNINLPEKQRETYSKRRKVEKSNIKLWFPAN